MQPDFTCVFSLLRAADAIKAIHNNKGRFNAHLTRDETIKNGKKKNGKNFTKRHCNNCAKERPKIAETHDTEYCRFNEEDEKLNNTETLDEEEKKAEDNKPNNGYFFDTAATKSFTNGKVNNPRPIFGKKDYSCQWRNSTDRGERDIEDWKNTD